MTQIVSACLELPEATRLDTVAGVDTLIAQISAWIKAQQVTPATMIVGIIPEVHPQTREATTRTLILYVPERPIPGHVLLQCVADEAPQHRPIGMVFVSGALRMDRHDGEQALDAATFAESVQRLEVAAERTGTQSLMIYVQHQALGKPRLYEAAYHGTGDIGKFRRSDGELATYGGVPNFLGWREAN